MTASILNGKTVAAHTLKTLKARVSDRVASDLKAPGLAVILVGDDPASTVYVNHKRKACVEIGMETYAHNLPSTATEAELLALISRLNQATDVHGILVQLPLPKHIDKQKVIEAIHPDKDVDGFHPYNLGRLAQGYPKLRPCTPYGVIKLLEYYDINPSGMNAVVIGASNIVGRPMALELLMAKATVTICHSQTKALKAHIQSAELLIIATGSKDILSVDWLHENQIIVDVGIHREADGRLRGDIDVEKAKEKVAWITPVPGGVGPMTIATLLENTLLAASLS